LQQFINTSSNIEILNINKDQKGATSINNN
jgi:hypothetical protein